MKKVAKESWSLIQLIYGSFCNPDAWIYELTNNIQTRLKCLSATKFMHVLGKQIFSLQDVTDVRYYIIVDLIAQILFPRKQKRPLLPV